MHPINRFLCALLLGGLSLTASSAQAVTSEEQADRIQQVYSFILDFRSNAAPLPEESGTLDLQADLLLMPEIDNRVGAKNEPVDTLPVVPRLRGRYHLPFGLVLGLAGSPGIPTGSQTATFWQGELDWRGRAGNLVFGGRTSLSSWKVVGAMTTKEYDDTFRIEQNNLDGRVGWDLGGWIPYAGYGTGQQDLSLLIGEDDVLLELKDQSFAYQFIGLELRWSDWDFVVEQHQTEDFLQHIQFSVKRRF